MRERPILFSGPMVRAILAGQKTQTRRAVSPQPSGGVRSSPFCASGLEDGHGREIRSRYGRPGDRLWVRESFDFLPTGGHDDPQACEIVYWADGSTEPRSAPPDYNPMIYGHPKARPSIHMPRWASRITLEIVSVRVERLQEISEADCIAEGIQQLGEKQGWATEARFPDGKRHFGAGAYDLYHQLWDSINGAGDWAANPWVWVVEFRRVGG
jgi:hypothetical protein